MGPAVSSADERLDAILAELRVIREYLTKAQHSAESPANLTEPKPTPRKRKPATRKRKAST